MKIFSSSFSFLVTQLVIFFNQFNETPTVCFKILRAQEASFFKTPVTYRLMVIISMNVPCVP